MPKNLPRGSVIGAVRGPYAYPGTKAGFDPSHPLSAGCRFSGVVRGSGFISLVSGKAGTTASAPSSKMDPNIGSSLVFSGTNEVDFTGQSTTNDTQFTIAALAYLNSTGATATLFNSDNTSSAGCSLGCNSAGLFGAVYTGVNRISSSTTLSTGVPYFLIGSRIQAIGNFAVVNLKTGQTFLSTTSGGSGTPTAPSGTYEIGNAATGQTWTGGIAAVMFSNQYRSLPDLAKIASDPFSFWYPR